MRSGPLERRWSAVRDCNERRAEIMRILIARRSETQTTLAVELGVSVSTVYRDIVRLTVDYPSRPSGGTAAA